VIAKEWAVKALTLELATEIKRQADLGTPHRAIAKEIGVKTQQIKTALKWLYHLDDPIPVKRERPKASKRNRPTTEERRHRLTMLSVRDQQLKDERDRWLAEDLTVEVATLIRNQVIMGKSARVIAEQLGIQIESVAQALGWLAQRNGQSERDRARKRKGIKDLKPAIGAISRQPGDKKFQHIFKGNQEKRRSSGRFPQIHIQPSIELLHFSNPRPVREYTDAEIDRRLSRSIGRVGF
jgi:hypothetical protein